jgi:histidyl-tRNA synthetase
VIYEHEIPKGSKLYFGDSAKIKRKIEQVASEILYKENFEEIVTPFFSLHQHNSISEKELIRFSNIDNQLLSLRADSTLDVVRLVTRRLGRTTNKKRWFYIQPVFRYPSDEVYQIGGEFIGEPNIKLCIDSISKILANFNLKPLLFISNVKIPKIISQILDIPFEDFENSDLEKVLSINVDWLIKLIRIKNEKDIDEVVDIVPKELKSELLKLRDLSLSISYENKVIEPLFYSKMRYYDSLFFGFLDGNHILASGGNYTFEKEESSGFGIYSDDLIEKIIKRDLEK